MGRFTRTGGVGYVAAVLVDSRLAVLRHQLELARADGISFAAAWPPALERALDATSDWERIVLSYALESTRRSWLAAYTGARPPTAAELAAVELQAVALNGEIGYLAA